MWSNKSKYKSNFFKGKFSILTLFFMLLISASVFADHDNSAAISPEWSPPGQTVDYTVTICNVFDGNDSIDEVRIYGNPLYSGFAANPKEGWYLGSHNPIKNYYPYTANDSSSYIDKGECTDFTFSATTPDPADCDLTWQFETRDVTDVWKFAYDTTSVDDMEMMIIKTVGDPKIDCDGQECDYWITQSTNIKIEAYDQGECGVSGLDYCDYRYSVDGSYAPQDGGMDWTRIQWQNVQIGNPPHYFFNFKFDEDSEHFLEIECYDVAGNYSYHSQTLKVDDTPPETTKTYGDPSFPEGINTGDPYPHWITTSTQITLDAPDGGDVCHIDGVTTYYYDEVVDDFYCEFEGECQPVCIPPTDGQLLKCDNGDCPLVCDWETYSTSFTKGEESCHILQFYSEDALGNVEEMDYQCVFVEDKPPVAEKTVGNPKVPLCDERAPEAYTEYFTEEDFSQQVFNVDLIKEWDTVNAKWTVDLSGIDGHWSTGVQVIITDGTTPLFLVGWDPNNTSTPTYKTYNGGWSAIMALPSGITVSGNYNEIHYEIVIPGEYLNGCDYGWAINTEASWPDHSSSVQQNYPADWVRWTGTNAAGSGINDWWVKEGQTEITLSCEDQLPHPVDHEEVCYKVSFDDPQTPWLTEQYCNSNGGTIEGDWCCADVSESDYTIVFAEESMHDLEYYCRDALGNETEIDLEYFRVDGTPPVISKDMFGQYSGDCPKGTDLDHGDCYVADNGTSGVDVSVIDPDTTGKGCNVDNLTCRYVVTWKDQTVDSGSFGEEGAHITFTHDSTHELYIYCQDQLGNWVEDTEYFLVDSNPPVTTKTYGTPTKVFEGYRWITSATPITLDAVDNKIGVKEINYRVTLLSDMPDQDCMETCRAVGDGSWTTVTGETTQFTIGEDSCHYIEFYAEDLFGYVEKTNSQCVFVDNSAPDVDKKVGEPKIDDYDLQAFPETEGLFHWVTQETEITFDCIDVDPHPVEQETVCFKVSFDDPATPWLTEEYCEGPLNNEGYCCEYVGEEPYSFYFTEDSVHDLEYYCEDHLGNTSEEFLQYYKVDDTPPVTTKKYIEPFYEDGKGIHWIDTASRIELTVEDGGDVCHVDGVTTYYSYNLVPDEACWNSESCHPVETGWTEYEGAFGIPEESCHVIQFYSKDELGNTEDMQYQCVFVDKTPPEITKEYEGPFYVGIPVNEEFQTIGNGTAEWSNLESYSQPYSARLYVPNGATDMAAVEFNVDIALEDITELSFFQKIANTYGVNVILGVDSDGDGVYEAQDKLWHIGATQHDPAMLGDDSFIEMDGMYLSSGNWEEVDGLSISQWWTPNNAGDGFCAEFGWNYLSDIQSAPKCRIEPTDRVKVIRLVIGGSGSWMDKVAFVDDLTLNGITNTLSGPEWINFDTEILIDAEDVGPHPSGLDTLEYRITLVEDEACWDKEVCQETEGSGEWTEVLEPVSIGEESCHLIEITATDNVDKTNEHKQCVFVDNTPPNPDKQVGEPKDMWDGADSAYYPEIAEMCWQEPFNLECWKVTLLTPITLECIDPDPHPVNHNTACYFVELDGDDVTEQYCESGYNANQDGYCCLEEEKKEFYFSEETEHNLKYYCEDALGNIGPIDDEKFKVEGRTFEIELNKKWNLISVPFVLINNNIEDVFEPVMDNVESVWTYDAFTGEWYVYHPGQPGISNLDSIIPGWGYWLRAYEDDMLVLGGHLFSPATTPPSRDLAEGWNLIGYYGLEGQEGYYGPNGNGKAARCALFSLGDSLLDKGWTSLVSYWEPFNPDQWLEFGYTDDLDPGAGYWVSATEENKYEYTTACGLIV